MVGIDILIYLLGIAAVGGGLMARFHHLEKKMDEFNPLLERQLLLEAKFEALENMNITIENEVKTCECGE